MTFIDQQDYGIFTELVSIVGSLLAATGAIGLGWRRRTKWEPWEEDVATAPQKVGSLVAAIAIALLWTLMRGPAHVEKLSWLSGGLGIVCVVFLLIYGFVIAMQTYQVIVVLEDGTTQTRNIIGGFWLTSEARVSKNRKSLTVQDLLKGLEYDPDKVWPRLSRALAKMVFVMSYLGLTVSGTIAIAAAAMLLEMAIRK